AWIFFETSREGGRRKLKPGYARSFESSLHIKSEMVHMPFDHLLDIVGHADFDFGDINSQFPGRLSQNDKLVFEQVVDRVHHEQRISIGAMVNQPSQTPRESIARKHHRQIVEYGSFRQVLKRNLSTQLLRHQLLLDCPQRMTTRRQLSVAISTNQKQV